MDRNSATATSDSGGAGGCGPNYGPRLGLGAIVGIVALSLIGGVVGGYVGTKLRPPKREVVVAPVTTTLKAVGRRADRTWPELEQRQVDDLTGALRAITPKPDALILCRDRSECGDMALDLENAFETAHWPVKIDVPFDETDGLTVNDPALFKALAAAGIEAKLTGQIPLPAIITPEAPTIVIGRRPRG